MYDLFFCHVPSNTLREAMASVCALRWKQETDRLASFHFLTPEFLKCGDLAFQRQRRVYAEEQATTEFYIVADDDCLLLQPVPADIAMPTDFGILSLLPQNATINPWTPEGYEAFNDGSIMEHESVGQIRIVRKGALTEFPMPTPGYPGYDLVHCQAMRAHGYRTGYLKNLRLNHLGEGYSTVWGKVQ